MVDDVTERAMREATSQSEPRGCRVTLSKMGDVITMVARLGMEAQRQMTDEVVS